MGEGNKEQMHKGTVGPPKGLGRGPPLFCTSAAGEQEGRRVGSLAAGKFVHFLDIP